MSWFRKPSSTPLWRDEFSVFTADERYVNRRQFTKFLTLTSFGMLAGNLWILARSGFHRAPAYPAAGGGGGWTKSPVGGVKTVRVSDGGRSVHSGAHRRAIPTSRTARSARISPARSTTRRSRTGWSARATRASSRSPMARCCKVRRSARCRAWRWKRRMAQLVAIRHGRRNAHERRIRRKTAG